MIAFIKRVITWIKVNIATIVNAAQLLVKAVKELLTATVNLISIFFPTFAAQAVVLKIREVLNWIDDKLESIKTKFNLIPVK